MHKGFATTCLLFIFTGLAFAGVSVSSPSSGSTSQSPVHFVASATSSCSSGVSAMGIYASPSVLSYSVRGAKLDTSLNLAPGTYSTVVQEWDNCGGSLKQTVVITVTGGNVQVTSPAANATITGPVRFVASSNTACSKGVAAMGIYPAPFQLAYKVNGGSLDTTLNLAAGKYSAVVQEWDQCGGASTKPVTFTVNVPPQSEIAVTVPLPNASVTSPVHYVATASTTCAQGISAVGVYVNDQLATSVQGANLDMSLPMAIGKQNTVVQSWDKCGGSQKSPIAINVTDGGGTSNPGETFSALQNSEWRSYGELAPIYDICTDCSPKVTWGTQHGVNSPSLSGSSMATSIGGTVKYSDALWNNHLIGDLSSQGLPDGDQKINSQLHNFVYDVYFFGTNLETSQSLEFDINQFVGGRGHIWGHECRMAGGHEWAIWDNPAAKWVTVGIPCHPLSNAWNHLRIQVQRMPDDKLLYQTITLNDETHTLNWVTDSTPTSWRGITINYQLDGNKNQDPYTVYLDNLNFTYY